MKKIYSFVLMATMLFVGTNVWAVERTVGTGGDYSTLAAAVNAASAGDVIKLVSPVTENASGATQVWINKDLTLNLQNYQYLYKGAKPVFIGITSGSLTIKGNGTGKLEADAITEDLIRVFGTYEKIDAKTETPAAKLVIEEGATIQSNVNAISIDVMRKGQPAKFGKANSDVPYSCNFFHSAGSGYGVANGVKIEIAGEVLAGKYGIKCNGTVRNGKEFANKAASWFTYEYPSQGTYTVNPSTDENYSPYIHVTSTGNIATTDVNSKKAVAVYASGYARWLIQGECTGSSGVYVKSGEVNIDGATIASNYNGAYDPVDDSSSKSGVTGAGSAVAIESNENYSGDMDVTIGGGATLTAGSGYALEEKVSNNAGTGIDMTDSKVDVVTIEGATFNAGNNGEGAIIISEATSEAAANSADPTQIVVTSATIKGSVTITGTDPDDSSNSLDLNDFVSTSVVIEPATAGDPTIVVPLDVNLTSDHYASFSSPIDLFIVAATSSDCKPYVGVVTGDKLVLTQVNYIKANEGVILYGDDATSCHFTTGGTADDSYDGNSNDLKPSSAWTANSGNVFCLRNVTGTTMLYQYTGATMPANKAYLDLGPAPAPARIRMVFSETQGIEDAEATVKALKFVENGQVLIKRGENIYNVQGQIVK